MRLRQWLKKERKIWHRHFVPALFAAVTVAVISQILKATVSNVILFASIGASAFILTNAKRHHLMILRTTILAYFIAAGVAGVVYTLDIHLHLPLSVSIFLLVFLMSMALYLFNAVHPPAVSASLSFILFDRAIFEIGYLLIAILFLFLVVRLITYMHSRQLTLKEFIHEFKKHH